MMIDWRDILLTIVGAVCFALLLVVMASCQPAKVVTVTEVRDSIRDHYHTDSILVYKHDSIFVKQAGDTIYFERWHTVYRDRAKTDTLFLSRDVEKPVPIVTEVAKPYIPSWVWWLVVANVLAVIAAGVRLYFKIRNPL